MWLTELFNRSDPAPMVVVTAGAIPARIAAPPLLGGTALDALPLQAAQALLPDAPRMPRELTQDEVVALLDAADASTRLVVLLLLSGIDVDETVGLRGSDVDVERNVIRIEGASARDISMSDPLRALVAPLASTKERLLVVRGLPATTATIDAQILCAAHDARLASATEVDARCLRHTFISYLVRQGIRFADLQRLVGSLTAPMFAAYAKLSPAGPPASGQSIQAVFPSLQRPIYESDLDDEQFVK
jgi:integrase